MLLKDSDYLLGDLKTLGCPDVPFLPPRPTHPSWQHLPGSLMMSCRRSQEGGCEGYKIKQGVMSGQLQSETDLVVQ